MEVSGFYYYKKKSSVVKMSEGLKYEMLLFNLFLSWQNVFFERV